MTMNRVLCHLKNTWSRSYIEKSKIQTVLLATMHNQVNRLIAAESEGKEQIDAYKRSVDESRAVNEGLTRQLKEKEDELALIMLDVNDVDNVTNQLQEEKNQLLIDLNIAMDGIDPCVREAEGTSIRLFVSDLKRRNDDLRSSLDGSRTNDDGGFAQARLSR